MSADDGWLTAFTDGSDPDGLPIGPVLTVMQEIRDGADPQEALVQLADTLDLSPAELARRLEAATWMPR